MQFLHNDFPHRYHRGYDLCAMKRTTDYHQRAAEIIQSIQYATLATVTPDGLPWNSPVFALHDNEGAIYWVSDKEG